MKKTVLLSLGCCVIVFCLAGCQTFPQFVAQQDAFKRGDIAVFIEKESNGGTRVGNVTLHEHVLSDRISQLRSGKFAGKSVLSFVLYDKQGDYDKWTWFVLSRQQGFKAEYVKAMLAKAANTELFPKSQSEYDLGKALSNGSVYPHESGEMIVGVAQPSTFYTIIVFDNILLGKSVMPFLDTKTKAHLEQLCKSQEFMATDKRFRDFLRDAFGDAERTSEVARFFFDYFMKESIAISPSLKRSVETQSVSYKTLSRVGGLWKVEATINSENRRFVISMSLGKDGLPTSLDGEEKATY